MPRTSVRGIGVSGDQSLSRVNTGRSASTGADTRTRHRPQRERVERTV